MIKIEFKNGAGMVYENPVKVKELIAKEDYNFFACKVNNKLRDFDRKNFIYTRYADDICISCKQKFSPRKIIKEIEAILEQFNTPFKLNTSKIKFGSIAGKNYHLGTIINKDNQLKLGHKKNQKLRAAIFQYGMAHISGNDPIDLHNTQILLGNIAYAKAVDPKYIEHVIEKYSNKFGTNIEQHMIRAINGRHTDWSDLDFQPLQF